MEDTRRFCNVRSYKRMLQFALVVTMVSICQGGYCRTQGWFGFGSDCRFRCHCASNNCYYYDGSCQGIPKGCVKGWFGRYCQYADLTTTMTTTTTPSWLTDGNDTTCNPDQSSSVAVTFTQPLPFTWLRLHVHNQDLLHNFTLTFLTSGGSKLDCKDMRNATVDQSTIDFNCSVKTEVTQVIISGAGVKALCSAYISGGRNVAINQSTTQTSNYTSYYNSSNAVDGNTTGVLSHRSCALTSPSSSSTPQWTLTFSYPVMVNRYVLYNTDNSNGLKRFTLRSYDKNGNQEFYYRHPNSTYQQVYTVTNAATTKPISRVTITGEPSQLALCEAEMYGEYVCATRRFGPECRTYSGNCKNYDRGNFVSTGGCPSGCQTGYTGEYCGSSCQTPYYGENCQEKCSVNCLDQRCDRYSGECNHCVIGQSGDLCDEDCPDGYFGYDCQYQCSSLCEAKLCDPVTGACKTCPEGKTGVLCEDCLPGRYGKGCDGRCSENCAGDGSCDSVSGQCTHGCKDGYQGSLCQDACSAGKFGKKCASTCSEICAENDKGDGGSTCHHVTGQCLYGCKEGYSGPVCQDCPQGHYGDNCETKCSEFCGDDGSCDFFSGQCTHGCKDGYQGLTCNDPCAVGTFGKGCSSECPESCIVNGTGPGESPCHHITGFCLLGCKPDFDGQECKEPPESDSILPIAIGAGVGGFILLVVIIILGVCCYKKRRLQHKAPQTQRPKEVSEAAATSGNAMNDYKNLYKTDRESTIYEEIAVNNYENVSSIEAKKKEKKGRKQKNSSAETAGENNDIYLN